LLRARSEETAELPAFEFLPTKNQIFSSQIASVLEPVFFLIIGSCSFY
jgi:hypothetical protein